MNYTSNFTT